MVVEDAVIAVVDVVEHVHDFHRRAVLAQSGETDYVAEIYCHLLVQLRLHHTSFLQAFYYRTTPRETSLMTNDPHDASTVLHPQDPPCV